MDDPIFRMRAKVASKAGGHVFEERFLKLRGIQLIIAYRQAVKEENEQFELVKVLNDSWAKRISNHFKSLFIFTNPKMYKAYEEEKELQQFREEVKEEEFPELWEEMMQFLPSSIKVEEDIADPMSEFPVADPQMEEMLAGLVPYKPKKEGE